MKVLNLIACLFTFSSAYTGPVCCRPANLELAPNATSLALNSTHTDATSPPAIVIDFQHKRNNSEMNPFSSCGDGFCDGRNETCFSCPSDCGECDLQYLDKCRSPGHVSLTFDDGPHEFSPTLLALAKELNVKLTLFVIGNKLANITYQNYLKQYYDAGHTIASHTFTHPFVTQLTDAEIRDEMIKTDNAIFNLIGVRPIFMRNPYSDTNERTMALLDSMGYKSIFTSLDTEDTVYGDSDPNKILSNAVKGLQANPQTTSYVITQHETYNVSINHLPQIVNEINKRKYTIVPITTCFNANNAYRQDVCGDGKCSGYLENCQTCPLDCGKCPMHLP
ncbi:chitin deacetylase [Entomophthora muscae]|uniref:Chitin deacetylase n=1 Tax=Entomophthora muscae TaxID=34485 RepID=A0ACC2S8Z9_9FUNG|nr:chitin deacetylase [Entomophthora muscae]